MIRETLAHAEDRMKKTADRFKSDLQGIRTGRASISLVENIEVDAYNSRMKLNQLAGFNVVEGRIIEIRPWDAAMLPSVEKAIQASALGLTPLNDGKIIKLTVPSLTDERRRELDRQVNKMAETYRVVVRNERRTAMETVKKLMKDKKISEDDERSAETQLQKMTEAHIAKLDELLAHKLKEIAES